MRQKALEVLIYLIKNSERIVSLCELKKYVWKVSVSDSTVKSTIWAVRHFLKKERDDIDFIKTISSRGYLFIQKVEIIEIEESSIQNLVDNTITLGNRFIYNLSLCERLYSNMSDYDPNGISKVKSSAMQKLHAFLSELQHDIDLEYRNELTLNELEALDLQKPRRFQEIDLFLADGRK